MSNTKWSEWRIGKGSRPVDRRYIERIEVDGKGYITQRGPEMAMFDEQSGAVYEGVNRGQARSSGHVYPMQSEVEAVCRNAIRAAIKRDGERSKRPDPRATIKVDSPHVTGGISERTWMAGMVANGALGYAYRAVQKQFAQEQFAVDVVRYADAILAELADTGDVGAIEPQ